MNFGRESIDDIKVLLISNSNIDLPFNVQRLSDIKLLNSSIAQFKPDFILTIGDIPSILNISEFSIRKRWIHFNQASIDNIVLAIRNSYCHSIYNKHSYDNDWPLVTVYTGTYNTGDMIYESYQSLKEQTYGNWEWVVCDDGSDDNTYHNLLDISNRDHRVRPYRIPRSGKIGQVKDTCTRLAYGSIYIEFDHDDILVDTCLDEVVRVFKENPDVGFVYTDFAEVMPDGSPHRYYGPPWDQEGIYKEVSYRGKKYLQTVGPEIWDGFSDNTMDRYAYYLTVGPNHARCFRSSEFWKVGGYNKNLPVADDFDLFHRMYMRSKVYHLDKMLYIYRFQDYNANTTFTKNKSIQDHLQIARENYIEEFNKFNIERIKRDGFGYYSLIILSYNTKELTKKCIDSALESLNGKTTEVIVLDNNSTDGSVEMLEKYGNRIKLIKLEVNIGFARGCNYASRFITTWGNNFAHNLVFVNSDCVIDKKTVQNVINSLFFGNNIGAAGSHTNYAAYGVGDNDKEIDVPFVPGMFLAIKNGLFSNVGRFNPRLLTYEDNDLCKKIQRLGLRTVISADTWVYHDGHASFKANNIDPVKQQEISKIIHDELNKRISAVCIVKNEENCIGEWITQWAGYVDEVLIYDTGSTDDTINKARQYGAKVIEDNMEEFRFDTARNNAIQSADADWIIMLDADESLDHTTIVNIRDILYNTEFDILLSRIVADYGDNSREVIGRPIIFKKSKDIKWISAVHEKLIGSAKQVWLKNSTVTHHMGYHTNDRRNDKETFYNDLQSKEPFYNDMEYRKSIEDQYPILDWNKPNDDRIKNYYTGDLITIVMPTFNRLEKLKRAVDSVLNQSYQNWELIIVGDNCPVIDKVMCDYNDDRIYHYNLSSNHGAGGAVPRNYAINMGSGDYIAYLDDDNYWLPDHLQSLYSVIGENKYAFSSFNFDGFDIISTEPKKYRIDTSTILHKRELIDKYGLWKDRIEAGYSHDWEFVSRWSDESYAFTKLPTLIYDNEYANQSIHNILFSYNAEGVVFDTCANYKIGAVMLVSGYQNVLAEAIKSTIDYVDNFYIMVMNKGFNGSDIDNYEVLSIIDNLKDLYNDKMIVNYINNHIDETNIRNAALDLLAKDGCTHCLIQDSDEVWDNRDIGNLIAVSKHDKIDAITSHMDVYWKDYLHKISPLEPFSPPVIARVGRTYFKKNRILTSNFLGAFHITIPYNIARFHHFSYVGSDDYVLNKLNNFSHKHEIIDNWYDVKWLNWNEDMVDLHPINPVLWHKAIKIDADELPEVISYKIKNNV